MSHDRILSPSATMTEPADGSHTSPVGTPLSDISLERVPSARRMRLSQVVDKLGKSISIANSASGSVPPRATSPRRLFSLKKKGRNSSDGADDSTASTPMASSVPSPSKSLSSAPPDDSPFITPPSPSLFRSFRGDGSMRAGTQTLIQALQAIPWVSQSGGADDSSAESNCESDDEGNVDTTPHLASSIHTIYRPLARSRHRSTVSSLNAMSVIPPSPDGEDSSDSGAPSDSDQDSGNEDFEADNQTPRILQGPSAARGPYPGGESIQVSRPPPSIAAGSTRTVRRQRRNRLATKLRSIFDIDGIEQVFAELPCWLLRSVLLQGYMYLTNSCLCFFAHMPSREDQILKSGALSKKASRTKRWIKHWFILKNDALSWYHSSTDPYFPHGIVDLRYAISCDAIGDKEFRVRTNQRTVNLFADSKASRDEWVKAIRKVIFRGQNLGDSVKIAIPYAAVLDVERSSAMDFSETIELKVVDKSSDYSVDSFFFAYFDDLPAALEQIRDAVRTARLNADPSISHSVLDTTALCHAPEKPSTSPTSNPSIIQSASSRLGSLLRPFHPSTPSVPTADTPDEEFTHISTRSNSSSFVPVTSLANQGTDMAFVSSPTSEDGPGLRGLSISHTYPPSASPSSSFSSDATPIHREPSSNVNLWNMSVPSWLKTSRRALGSIAGSSDIKEVYSTAPTSSTSTASGSHTADMTFSILENPGMAIDPDVQEKFRSAFAYDEKEILLGYFPGYLFRILPLSGKLYVSTNHFCFKSSGPLTVRTKMTLPIRDILAIERSKGTRFGHHGLIVVIKGHEELFFELWAEDRRDALAALLERQIDDVQKRQASGESAAPSQGDQEALILEDFDGRLDEHDNNARALHKSLSDSLTGVMFTSASSTFLTFKPPNPLHFTFLTIGSRGDVQPYIALAKGLIAEGHRVRIATHLEFKEWILSHEIEYGYVGGDPAELMRICVENGLFTVSFLRETMQKFRGWLDDLLKTSWEACQGTDVLIESPSAMGGLHIAEALRIPYFRAFTMTWSRTRAYPHAFAVPERKMGGSYNYMSYVMFDQVFWRAISGQVNRWRKNMLHIQSTSLDKMEPHKVPFLYNFSRHVVPPPLDWPEWIKITGYWFLDDADVSSKKWAAPEPLLKFIASARKDNKKLVYIGFGSIVVSDPKGMTRCVIESIVKSGVRAVLSKGWSDRLHSKSTDASEIEEPLPKEIYPITSIPHDWLFRQIDAACHHGGAGTTGASLRAGIPTIIHPFFGDQFFWADRVEALGVGSGVRKLTVEHLTDALIAATTDPKQISKAKILGEQIRSENGVSNAIEAIYRDLEHARSNVKRPRDEGSSVTDEDESLSQQEAQKQSNLDRSATHTSSRLKKKRYSGRSSSGSRAGGGAPSEDWSVISDKDKSSSSDEIQQHLSEYSPPRQQKRQTIASVVKSALTVASS